METNIIQRPILFSGPMVRAILDGRKTQTRRVIYNRRRCDYDVIGERDDGTLWPWREGEYAGEDVWYPCPYGKPGDLLWVRETWADVNCEEGPAIAYRADEHVSPWEYWCIEKGPDYGAGPSMNYDKYPGDYSMWCGDLLNGAPGHGWKPSIHMPKWACRLWLEVTGVRVERLQDIDGPSIEAEGAIKQCCNGQDCGCNGGYVSPDDGEAIQDPIEEFKNLWESINGEGSWDGNPWVWVVEFEKAKRPSDFDDSIPF